MADRQPLLQARTVQVPLGGLVMILITIAILFVLAALISMAYVFCEDIYDLNAGTAGTALGDAMFLQSATGSAKRRKLGSQDFGYPGIYAALGVEALAAGIQVPGRGYVELTLLNGGVDPNFDRWELRAPWYGPIGDVTAGDLQYVRSNGINEAFDSQLVGMPWPEGSTLVDASVSKTYGSAANTYLEMVLYMLAGPRARPSRGGKVHTVTYDAGGDIGAAAWAQLENAAQNAAGELRKDHLYRLLWGALDAQAADDTEALAWKLEVSGYPALIGPGGGSYFNAKGFRRIWFLTDSVMMRGDEVHKVSALVGADCQPLVHLGWEDMGQA